MWTTFADEVACFLGTGYKFVDDNTAAGVEKFPIRLLSTRLIYTWHDVPLDDFLLPTNLQTAIQACLDVNDDEFDERYPAGTLLMPRHQKH